MRYRTLGASGCAVSAFALGTMTFGSETDEKGSHAQMDRFLDAGGNLIDTADVYSGTESESIIGRWLAKQPAEVLDRVVIATKGRFPTGPGPNDLGLSRRHLSRAIDASLRRLGIECIDLYQVHAHDPWTPIEETLRALDDAVHMGKVNYVGLSNFTGWQLQKAVDVAVAHNLNGTSHCSLSTACSCARSSGKSSPRARRKASGSCRGRHWAGAGLRGSTGATSDRRGLPVSAKTPSGASKPMIGEALSNGPGT